MTFVALRYDMRTTRGGVDHAALYRAAMEQIRWADGLGIDSVVLSEHHVSEEGYLPSPLVMAGAVAAATKRINITIAALVAGLHHPIRLAEDLAVLDHLSDGRLMVVLGIGYRTIEFEVFGADRARRGPLLEELVAVLRQAWTGEPFDFRGTTVVVRPKPLTPGGPNRGGPAQAVDAWRADVGGGRIGGRVGQAGGPAGTAVVRRGRPSRTEGDLPA
jgi:alkanesulfonate monooxygenase SsuD/methylene tetrahydromethanopterin reductase-like flavin-dependent oxidoreductase (luciferase family)